MINPKELRIGNLVYLDNYSLPEIPQEVNLIHAEFIHIYEVSSMFVFEYPCERIHPIPITPEWLERLGFEKGVERQYRINLSQNVNVPMFFIISIETWIATGDTPFDYYAIYGEFGKIPYARINSIHQLQNLYFALTGEELKIKEA